MSTTESKQPALTADPQDPLPESGFFYRRITVWVVSIAVLGLLAYNVIALRALENSDGIVRVSLWLIGLLALIQTYYLIAPSAEHIVRLGQTVSAWKAGIATSVTSKVQTAKGTAETKTAAGPAQTGDDSGLPEGLR